MMYDLVAKRLWFFVVSGVVIIPGLISLILPGGIRPGIDFTSGSISTIRFEQPVDQQGLRNAYADLGHHEAIVQRSDEGVYIVRTLPLGSEDRDEAGNV